MTDSATLSLFVEPESAPTSGAVISGCGRYRYLLWRVWDPARPRMCWVMLNPSTADGEIDDPTIRKIIGYAKRLGFGSIVVVNLFAWRATDPKDLPFGDRPRHRDVTDPDMDAPDGAVVDGYERVGDRWCLRDGDPIGPDNDRHITQAVQESEMVVCGWGGSVKPRKMAGRDADVLALIRAAGKTPHALQINGDGRPAHPLYLRGALIPQPMVTCMSTQTPAEVR